MAAPRLPQHRWYECDGCGYPRLQARRTPKEIEARKVKCIQTPNCKGKMRGPIANPTGIAGWDDGNFVPERKVKSAK